MSTVENEMLLQSKSDQAKSSRNGLRASRSATTTRSSLTEGLTSQSCESPKGRHLNKLLCSECVELIEVRASKKTICQMKEGFNLPFKVSESCEDLVSDKHADFIKSGICGDCWEKRGV